MGRFLAGQSFGMGAAMPVLMEINDDGVAIPVASMDRMDRVVRIAELLNRHGMVDAPLSGMPTVDAPPVEGGAS